MRALRRILTTTGLLILAILPVAAAVSADAPPHPLPVAMTQPLTSIRANSAIAFVTPAPDAVPLPESGLLVLIGGSMIALAAMMRKAGNQNL